MTTGPADLTPLLIPPADTGVGFRQGTVVAFDRTTGANSIQVGGGIVTDLPMLNSLDALSMQVGDVVGILTSGPSWFIVGRIVTVGSPNLFQTLSSLVAVDADAAMGTVTSTTYTDVSGGNVGPLVTVNVGPSGRALCWFTLETNWGAPVSTGVAVYASVEVTGATTIAPSDTHSRLLAQAPVNEAFRVAVGTFHLFEGLNPGVITFTMKYRTGSLMGGPTPTCDFLKREIAVMVL